MQAERNFYKDALFGLAVGDALGVPVEFKSRDYLSKNPVNDFIGYGTYNLPPGTWSDDSSLAFCLAEALTNGFDLKEIANNFIEWRYHNYWTPRGTVFDIGMATHAAIELLAKGTRPDLAGGMETSSNGNGSLMRILPLLFYIKDKPIAERYAITKQVSSITHAHVLSVIACFYYLEFARGILAGHNKLDVYRQVQQDVGAHLKLLNINLNEVSLYQALLSFDIQNLEAADIKSSGYVLHTLEASIWCLLTTDSYTDAVCKAVNLGGDTDTTAAVTGGLAGLLYGYESIPAEWVDQLARKKDIDDLAVRLREKFST